MDRPPDERRPGLGTRADADTEEPNRPPGYAEPPTANQWARIPEWVAYAGLDATALRVLIILAAKAGRERVAWISQRTVAAGLGIGRSTVSEAIARLRKVGVLEDVGKVVVNHEAGTWVKRYRVVDSRSDQPVVGLDPTSVDMAPNQPVVGSGPTSGGDKKSGRGVPDVGFTGPDVGLRGPDVGPRPTHSVPHRSVPHRSVERLEDEREEPNPNGEDPTPRRGKDREPDVRALTAKVGQPYSKFDPVNPKDRANRCRLCGEYVDARRSVCKTHSMAEIRPLLEQAARGEELLAEETDPELDEDAAFELLKRELGATEATEG